MSAPDFYGSFTAIMKRTPPKAKRPAGIPHTVEKLSCKVAHR
jgi:hypothetical protein